MVTIVDAIENLVRNPVVTLDEAYVGNNRANNMGDALEVYVKDLFAGTFRASKPERVERQAEVFSYLGNNANPPDAMLRGGDAIEVKKIESLNSSLALNSSYPKHTIKSDSPMISKDCRIAEKWTEKDILYVVGIVVKGELRHLAMVYGLDYCASEACYQRLKTTIRDGVNSIPGVEFSESRELGHVNKVDPLGITYLRVRGMWGIENPWQVFDYVFTRDLTERLTFMCIINEWKWATLQGANRLYDLAREDSRLSIGDVKVKDPDNPAHLNAAKLVTFFV